MLWKVFALIVRIKSVLLRIINNKVRREINASLFAENLYLLLGQCCLEAISRSFVVGTEHDRVPAIHVQTQFVVVVSNLRKFLAHHGLYDLIMRTWLCPDYLRLCSQLLVLDIQRQRAILEHCSAFQPHVVSTLPRRSDSDFD